MTDPEALKDRREIRVLGVCGSLRAGSFNRKLLRAAGELVPEGVGLHVYEGLREIPPYDSDDDAAGPPEPVVRFKQAIADHDALLIATPEYNYGVPGVLKNALDWASRPAVGSVLSGKPTAIMGAAAGMSGTMRAQLSLRQLFLFTNTPLVSKPEVYVTFAPDKFHESGRLGDEPTRKFVAKLLESLAELTLR